MRPRSFSESFTNTQVWVGDKPLQNFSTTVLNDNGRGFEQWTDNLSKKQKRVLHNIEPEEADNLFLQSQKILQNMIQNLNVPLLMGNQIPVTHPIASLIAPMHSFKQALHQSPLAPIAQPIQNFLSNKRPLEYQPEETQESENEDESEDEIDSYNVLDPDIQELDEQSDLEGIREGEESEEEPLPSSPEIEEVINNFNQMLKSRSSHRVSKTVPL